MASPFHVYLQLRLFGEFKLTLPLYLKCSEPSWALLNINWPITDHAHHKEVPSETLTGQSQTTLTTKRSEFIGHVIKNNNISLKLKETQRWLGGARSSGLNAHRKG